MMPRIRLQKIAITMPTMTRIPPTLIPVFIRSSPFPLGIRRANTLRGGSAKLPWVAAATAPAPHEEKLWGRPAWAAAAAPGTEAAALARPGGGGHRRERGSSRIRQRRGYGRTAHSAGTATLLGGWSQALLVGCTRPVF